MLMDKRDDTVAMTEDELARAYDALRRRRQAHPTADLPSVEAIQALSEHRAPVSEREALLERVLESGASDELALLHSAASSGAAPLSSASTSGASTRPSPLRWWPAAVAAALLVVVGLPISRRAATDGTDASREEPRFRGAESTSAPRLLLPTGDATLISGQSFVWRPVLNATEYAIEILDSNGALLATFTATDTTMTLPANIPDTQRVQARGWTVTARLRDGRTLRSGLGLLRAP